jgi:sulfite exporter TauE/SafE
MTPSLALSALAMGVLGSGHCVVMCGGVVGVGCAALPPQARRNVWRQARFVAAFNAGRIASYSFAGAAVGAMAGLLVPFVSFGRVQIVLRLMATFAMLVVGAYVAGFAWVLSWVERAGEPVWRRITPIARRLFPVRSLAHAFALGTLWGWMPCGLVYSALAAAAMSGSMTGGALVMASFGAGTVPTLAAMGSAAGLVQRFARSSTVRRIAGCSLLALGIIQAGTVAVAWSAPSSEPPRCPLHASMHR